MLSFHEMRPALNQMRAGPPCGTSAAIPRPVELQEDGPLHQHPGDESSRAAIKS